MVSLRFGTFLSEWRAEHASPEQRLRRVVAMLVNEEDKLVRFGCPILQREIREIHAWLDERTNPSPRTTKK